MNINKGGVAKLFIFVSKVYNDWLYSVFFY